MRVFFLILLFPFFVFGAENGRYDFKHPIKNSFFPKDISLSVQPTSIKLGVYELAYDSKASLWTLSDAKKGWGYYDTVKKVWNLVPFGEIKIIAAEKGSAALVTDTLENIRGTFSLFKDALLRDSKPKVIQPFSFLPSKKYEIQVLDPLTLSNDPLRGLPSREWKMGQLLFSEKGGTRILFQSATLFLERGNSLGMGAERLPISGYQIVTLFDKDLKELGSARVMRMNQSWSFQLKEAEPIELKDSKVFYAVDYTPAQEMGRSINSFEKQKKKTN